jgi:excisionase family DNA binding protein
MMLDHPSEAEAEVETEATESPGGPTRTYFSRSEAARYLGVPVSTIYHWARTGRLPCILTLGGHMRFEQSDLDAANIRRPRASRWAQPKSQAQPDDTSQPAPN